MTITVQHYGFTDAIGQRFARYVSNNRKQVDPWFIRYTLGEEPARYPVPALLQDSVSDLATRWSHCLDTDRSFNIKY